MNALADDFVEVSLCQLIILGTLSCTWTLCRIGWVAILCSSLISVFLTFADSPSCTLQGNLCEQAVSIALGDALCGIWVLSNPAKVWDSSLQLYDHAVHDFITVGLAYVDVVQVSLGSFQLHWHVTEVSYQIEVEECSYCDRLCTVAMHQFDVALGFIATLCVEVVYELDYIVAVFDTLVKLVPGGLKLRPATCYHVEVASTTLTVGLWCGRCVLTIYQLNIRVGTEGDSHQLAVDTLFCQFTVCLVQNKTCIVWWSCYRIRSVLRGWLLVEEVTAWCCCTEQQSAYQ